jgi:hypothetical protein
MALVLMSTLPASGFSAGPVKPAGRIKIKSVDSDFEREPLFMSLDNFFLQQCRFHRINNNPLSTITSIQGRHLPWSKGTQMPQGFLIVHPITRSVVTLGD